jgi:hypothetical protein
MSLMRSDPRRLKELRRLYRDMTEIEMPASIASEVDKVSEQCVGAAMWADKLLDRIGNLFALLVEIYAYVKTLPAADDG